MATFSQPPGDDIGFKPWNSTTPVPVSIDGNDRDLHPHARVLQATDGAPGPTELGYGSTGADSRRTFEVYSDADRPRVHRITGPTATQTGPPFTIRIQLTEDVVKYRRRMT